jgi:tetratricopeptide (TPR) repeat protein
MVTRLFPPILLLLPALFLAACSSEPDPQRKEADAALAAAKSARGRNDVSATRTALGLALAINERLGRTAPLAETERLLAEHYAATADFDSALDLYARASAHYRELAERPMIRDIGRDMVQLRRQMGEDRTAFEQAIELLRLTRVFGDSAGVRDISFELLPICQALDERDTERRLAEDLLRSALRTGDLRMQARVHMIEGLTGERRGRTDRGAAEFLQAFTLAGQAGDSLLSIAALERLAMAMEEQGKPADALTSYAEALRRADRLTGARELRLALLTRVGSLYLRLGQTGEALRFYRAAQSAAIALGDRIAEGILAIQSTHCAPAGTDAGKGYASALALFRSIGYSPGAAYALTALGRVAERERRLTDALDLYRQAIGQAELWQDEPDPDDPLVGCERAWDVRGTGAAYDGLAGLLLESGKTEEAFAAAERKRGASLFRSLAAQAIRTGNANTEALLAAFRRLRSRRIGAERRFAAVLRTAESQGLLQPVRNMLGRTGTALRAAGTAFVVEDRLLEPAVQPTTATPAETAKRLPAGALLLAPVLAARSTAIYAITPARSAIGIAAVGRDQVLAAKRDFLEALQARVAAGDSNRVRLRALDQKILELGRVLYGALVRPVEAELRGATRLIVVLPEELQGLPLHALRKSVLRTDPYVAEQALVTYLPTAAALGVVAVPQGPVRDVVGFGFAGSTGWDVEYELRDIRAFYKDVRLHFGTEATAAVLARERGDLLHLALDFRADPRLPGNTHFVVNDGQSAATSTRLMLGDLPALPPFGAVVVSTLSAGEEAGPAALPYLLLTHGSGTVIITSLPPARKTKKVFGEFFYTALLSGLGADAAFRETQREMLRSPATASPAFWAPFVLWGK